MTATATQAEIPTLATQPQLSYIRTLLAQRQVSDPYRTDLEECLTLEHLMSRRVASSVIDSLKAMPYAPKAEVAPAAPVSLEGMHRLGQDIYKVQLAVHGSGRPYAKLLVIDEPDCGGCQNGEDCVPPCAWGAHFEMAPGAIRRLSEATRLSLEEAATFGQLYGVCCVCGATLTDEDSIAAGIGPICRRKF
ncbi:DUF6011 domain-containing protein [Tessaracoccus sp.]